MSLKNKTKLLSFYSKGIELALVLAILYTNIRLVESGNNEPKEFKKEVEKLSSACSFFEFSVFDESVAGTALKRRWSEFYSIDFMKNNASYAVFVPAESISMEEWADRYFSDQPKQVVVKVLIIHALNQES
jgi:NADP-dependent 3-hydroxy acid dehydrogenase YdfG